MSHRQLTTAQAKDAPLSADIHRLGDLLGETLKRLGGRRLFQTEERVRALCKKLRTRHSAATERQFKQLLEGLSLDDAIGVIRAFSVYFQLANIAEQHHRIRRKRYYELHTPDRPAARVAGRDTATPERGRHFAHRLTASARSSGHSAGHHGSPD